MNYSPKSILVFLAALVLCLSSIGQISQPGIIERIDSIVTGYMATNKMVGVSIGIVKDGKVYVTKGYGMSEINTNNPVDSITDFHLASVSKLFTATAIMQLVESGKIDLSTKLIDYIPDFSMKGDTYKNITVEQMLTHTSGIGNYFWKPKGADSLAIRNYAMSMANKKPMYEPGVTLNQKTYSNTGYSILGYLIETVTKTSFDSYITDHILLPVGMKHSGYFPDRIDKKHLSSPHVQSKLTGKVGKSKYYPNEPQSKPNANLISCSQDLCKWMSHNLKIYNDNIDNFNGVISRKTLKEMWTTTQFIPGKNTSIGLGWWIVDDLELGKYVFHVGNDPGFSSTLIIFPEFNFGITVLCNGSYPKQVVWNKIPFDIVGLFRDEWKKGR